MNYTEYCKAFPFKTTVVLMETKENIEIMFKILGPMGCLRRPDEDFREILTEKLNSSPGKFSHGGPQHVYLERNMTDERLKYWTYAHAGYLDEQSDYKRGINAEVLSLQEFIPRLSKAITLPLEVMGTVKPPMSRTWVPVEMGEQP